MQIPESIRKALALPLALIGLMIAVESLDFLLTLATPHRSLHNAGVLDRFGIRPRRLEGLWGIFLAPVLHRDFAHLTANASSLVFLAFFVALTGSKRFLAVTLTIVLATGLAVWIFGGSGSVHVGASGLIFGYIGYLLVKGFVEKHPLWILVSILVGILYSGYSRLLVPGFGGGSSISWESHLFGFLVGIATAWMMADHREESRSKRQDAI